MPVYVPSVPARLTSGIPPESGPSAGRTAPSNEQRPQTLNFDVKQTLAETCPREVEGPELGAVHSGPYGIGWAVRPLVHGRKKQLLQVATR